MAEGSDIWARVRVGKDNSGLVTRVVSAICWSIYREIFENSSHTVDVCVSQVYTDIMFWTGLLSDRERICISDDDDTYL